MLHNTYCAYLKYGNYLCNELEYSLIDIHGMLRRCKPGTTPIVPGVVGL